MGLIPEAPEEVEEDESVESGEGLQGVYIISVAARILEMHPQTLRKYERFGFISPFRTVGVRRLYSEEDIARLRLIKHLVGDLGLNLAGVQLVLDLFNELLNARAQTEKLEGAELKAYLTKALDTLFTLLYTGQSTGSDD
ncbi:MAG: MerR family transcriptional regulator [SAR202 cluster bacterium]|nr:MerR family transcriptional regulator [SAR202 cluster bacterium]